MTEQGKRVGQAILATIVILATFQLVSHYDVSVVTDWLFRSLDPRTTPMIIGGAFFVLVVLPVLWFNGDGSRSRSVGSRR